MSAFESPLAPAPRVGEVRAVTVSTDDLDRALGLYEGMLGMRRVAEWRLEEGEDFGALWGLPGRTAGRAIWLEQPGASQGAVRLIQFEPVSPVGATDGARTYDHGLIKNLDFFTNDVAGAYERFREAGHAFLAPPVTYAVGWGDSVHATEAHMKTADGVKFSLASVTGAPRKAFGEARHDTPFTEVAVAAQVVADYDRAVAFHCGALDCVPAADTVVDDPGLVAALHLPPGTRLRLCFIGPARAVGGKVGLIAYEGEGVRDARSLAGQCRPPHRGAVMLTYETENVDYAHARALVHGASEVAPPRDLETPPWGPVRASSVRSPDGILLELVAPGAERWEHRALLRREEVPDGTLRGLRVEGLGRLALVGVGGRVFAIEDRCPHLGGPLSKGALAGRAITCPWHGWTVDVVSGRVTGGDGLAARVCPLRVRGDDVCLPLPRRGDPAKPTEAPESG